MAISRLRPVNCTLNTGVDLVLRLVIGGFLAAVAALLSPAAAPASPPLTSAEADYETSQTLTDSSAPRDANTVHAPWL